MKEGQHGDMGDHNDRAVTWEGVELMIEKTITQPLFKIEQRLETIEEQNQASLRREALAEKKKTSDHRAYLGPMIPVAIVILWEMAKHKWGWM